MGLWERLRDARAANRAESARWLPTGPEDLSGAQVLYQTYGDGSNREPVTSSMLSLAAAGYAGSPIVFALTAVRMLLFAEAVPRWWDKEKRRFDADTDGLEILMSPWPGADHSEMQARAELDVTLAGNAFIVHPTDLDRLVRLRPDWVTIQRIIRTDSRGRPFSEVDGYWYSPQGVGEADWVWYDVGEVAHYSPYPDPLAEFRGMSWLTPVVRELSNDSAMTAYATKFFENSATPNIIVKYSQNLGPEKLRQAQEQIRQRHGGLNNSYKAMILDSGADVTIAGNSFEQMNFNSLRAATENRIASASGVPPMIPGFKEGLQASTLANYDAAARRLADMTMRPLWRSFSAVLRKIVVPPRKIGRTQSALELRFDATEVVALQEGKQAAADTFKTKALTAGELIRSGWDPTTVADAVEAQDMTMLVHTEKVPTALYDDQGAPANSKPSEKDGEDEPEDGDEEKRRPSGGKGGQGAAAPQPLRAGDVRALMESQREAMIEAFRAGIESGRLTIVEPSSERHLPGKHDQKSHAGGGGGGGESGTGSKDDPVVTGDAVRAAHLLAEGKYVRLEQERQTATLLGELKRMVDDAKAKGEKAPDINLCKASVAGSNLFCVEGKDIPRIQMPQLKGVPLPGSKAAGLKADSRGEVDVSAAFRERLKAKGIGTRQETVDPSVLRATQNELDVAKTIGISDAMMNGTYDESPIFISDKGDYIVDGHHRWSAKVATEYRVGHDLAMPVEVIEADIITILGEANDFCGEMGLPQVSMTHRVRAVEVALVESALGRALVEWLHGA